MRKLVTITLNSRKLKSGKLAINSEYVKVSNCIYSRLPERVFEHVTDSYSLRYLSYFLNKDKTLVYKGQLKMATKI